ncbi:glycerophosphodiester phosphodiesterase [Flocculibacter collagenilyticus]|uniref:glycerophosphodiester phosphodiesterase n=1 Tax=Flocculibacter collagenilyticus TaxID=2744479 RepID=UPI0018F3313E|nr:glycerophosphodiester phosphodiesterase family protein [Flocculibacter collagenilyticus]
MLIIAHRGASGNHPENTLKAINAAAEMGVDGIEIDVHLVEDELIVIHDKWLHRTTNGTGQISDYSLAELQALDAGEGECIPTLWQVLQCINARTMVNIELKGNNTAEKTIKVIDQAVEQLGYTINQFIISSFNHHVIHSIHQQRPDITIGALTGSMPLGYASFAKHLNAYSIHLDVSFINKEYVQDAHERGLKVFVYTVDQKEDIIAMHALGVDGIFTNHPSTSKVILAHQLTPASIMHE